MKNIRQNFTTETSQTTTGVLRYPSTIKSLGLALLTCLALQTCSAGPEISPENTAAARHARFMNREEQDLKSYSAKQLQEIDSLYYFANKNWNTPEAKESLLKLVAMKQYGKANRTGCALLYLGQMSSGQEKENSLKQAIQDHGDCMYGDGVQVGAYARFLLAEYYQQIGKMADALTLLKEIQKNYPSAIDHPGRPLAPLVRHMMEASKSSPLPRQNKIVEGEGWRGFRVGTTREELIKALGAPDTDSTSQWLKWKKFSVHCIIDDKHGAAELRFDKGFKGETAAGIEIGSTLRKTLEVYGEPTAQEDRGQGKKLIWSPKGLLIWLSGDKVSQIVVFSKH